MRIGTTMNYSIVITTFDKRFDAFLVPLVKSIKAQRPDVEIIVTANGPCRAAFDPDFRSRLLAFLATQPNCFPTVFPTFQSLAKMWNRGVLTATEEQVLVLNDDLIVQASEAKGFFDLLESALATHTGTFKINGSFSHYVVAKSELIDVGFFDERLLGLGEEDGGFYWRYHEKYGREIPSVELAGIENVCSDLADDGYVKGIRTAAKFNRDFIKNEKYREVLIGGHRGMFDKRVKRKLPDAVQYPYEQFARQHSGEV
jgi:hypothetical protein